MSSVSVQVGVRRALIVFALIVLCAIPSAGIHAQDTASAERFLRDLYAPYASGSNGLDKLAKPEAIYDPELLALVLRDRANMEKYEKGLLRVDPICGCQDWDALRVLRVTVQPEGTSQLNATVTFSDFGERSTFSYQLVSIGGQWRIYDIRGSFAPSLRQYLLTGLARVEQEIGKSTR